MTDSIAIKKQFTFLCTLHSKEDIEERFEFIIQGNSCLVVLDEVEDYLTRNWGFITKRTYYNERMKSERYWTIDLKSIDTTVKQEKEANKK